MDVDNAAAEFSRLREDDPRIDEEKWSEADTRSKFIDRVLINCLGWGECDIRRELSDNALRLDYILSTVQPVVVVEAKKADLQFPVRKSSKPYRIRMASLLKADPGLRAHVEQLREYCFNWSVPVGVLTNGKSYLVFVAVRSDGVPYLQRDAIVIADIFDPKFNYSDLHNLLAREIVFSGELFTVLAPVAADEKPKSVLATYSSRDSVKGSNPIGLALQPLLEQVFTDVSREDSREVLEHCYVPPGSSSMRNAHFEALLIDRPPNFALSANVISVNSRNTYDKFQESIKNYLARQCQGQTVLVTGSVGVGKTMFLMRYFLLRHGADPRIGIATVPFFIDFRLPELDPTAIPSLIYRRIRSAIEDLDGRQAPGEKEETKYDLLSPDGLRQVFWPQVQKLERGFDSRLLEDDPLALVKQRQDLFSHLLRSDEDFVKGAVRVLRDRYHRYVCVILDNADRCPPAYQEAVYLFSRTLEADLQCLIIVALREEWYWYFGFADKDGPFSAYHDTVYHITPPRTRDVLEKRLEYSIESIQEHKLDAVTAELENNIVLNASHLTKYLRVCKRGFIESDEITLFFECLSNGTVRKGLKAFLTFLRSGHTHVNEYLKAFVAGHDYTLSFHHVFKSIAYGQYNYYASKRSLVPNIFTPVHDAHCTHIGYFTRFNFLTWLEQSRERPSPEGDGYIASGEARGFLAKLGVPESLHVGLIKDAIRSDLVPRFISNATM
jgi:hypothetical protein